MILLWLLDVVVVVVGKEVSHSASFKDPALGRSNYPDVPQLNNCAPPGGMVSLTSSSTERCLGITVLIGPTELLIFLKCFWHDVVACKTVAHTRVSRDFDSKSSPCCAGRTLTDCARRLSLQMESNHLLKRTTAERGRETTVDMFEFCIHSPKRNRKEAASKILLLARIEWKDI